MTTVGSSMRVGVRGGPLTGSCGLARIERGKRNEKTTGGSRMIEVFKRLSVLSWVLGVFQEVWADGFGRCLTKKRSEIWTC